MSKIPPKLAKSEELLLQHSSQEVKILFILYKTDKIRHSEIIRLNTLYPGIQRKSSRTFYKMYQKLISSKLITKIKDITVNRQYYAYSITQDAREYIQFLLNQPDKKINFSFLDYQNYLLPQKKIKTEEKSISNDSAVTNKYFISEIQELKAELKRIKEPSNHGYPMNQQFQPQQSPAYPQTPNSDYSPNSNYLRNREPTGEFQGFADPRQYGDDDDEIDNRYIDDEGVDSQEDTVEIEEEIEEEPEEEIIELSEEERHRIYLDGMSNSEYLEYYRKLPGSLLRSEETKGEFWMEVDRRKLDSSEKHVYFQGFLQIYPKYQSHSEIEILISKFQLNEADLNVIYGNFRDQNKSLEFLDLIMEYLIKLIYQKISDNQLKLDESYTFSGAKFTIQQFIHYPIKLYYDKMKLAISLKYIELLKTNLAKTTEFSFKYELKVFLDLQLHNHLKSLITQELVQKERIIKPKATEDIWYLIFRVYYESQDLENFLQLPSLLPEWKEVAKFELNNIRDLESIPSITKFKGVYGLVCPFFDNDDIIITFDLVNLFVNELKKTMKRSQGRGVIPSSKSNQFIHLYVPYFASWLHKIHRSTGSEKDYSINLLLNCSESGEMFKGYTSVYEEILEQYSNWVNEENDKTKDYRKRLDQIALMRTRENEKIEKIFT
ncbi:MAG: hypothetical protein ACTSRK_02280 [Promethearchaeota archaeon]